MKFMTTKLSFIALGLFACGLLLSCEEDQKPKTAPAASEDPKNPAGDPADSGPSAHETYYQIPSPNDLITFVKEGGLSFDANLVDSEIKISDIVGKKSQALNFGKNIADVAYASTFGNTDRSRVAFSNLERLSNDLGISTLFSAALLNRIKENLQNTDSLMMISNDTYFSTIDYLEDNGKGDLLGLMAAGGWIESMYIVSQSVGEFDAEAVAVEQIADQKPTFENLMAFLGKYKSDPDVAAVLESLGQIQSIYDGIPDGSSKMQKDESGRMVLGGSKRTINQEQFDQLKAAIASLRNDFAGSAG